MASRPTADDPYGSYGSVQSAPVNGPDLPSQNIHATSDSFGGQIGQALENAGDKTHKFGQDQIKIEEHFAQMASEAKAKDDFVDQDYPQILQARSAFDNAAPEQKVHAAEQYTQTLRTIRDNSVARGKTPYEKEVLHNLVNSKVEQESEYAQNSLAKSQEEMIGNSNAKYLLSLGQDSALNYNNPARVESNFNKIDAAAEMHVIDSGVDPNSPDFNSAVQEAQRTAKGATVVGMVNQAISSGDVHAASQIYDDHSHLVPGHQQLAIDSAIHIEGTKQTSQNYSKAILTGNPLPEPVGSAPRQVQAVVADTAQNYGVDPNHALTVARIESNYGQNVGKRGDIGQTGKGGDIYTQAGNMVSELKKSQGIAEKSLGRTPEPWETYAIYQQGAGGGPALFSSASNNPMERAVDALTPLYKDRQTALSAIVNNGGNATMTSGQFLDFIKQKYAINAKAAQCDFPKTDTGTTGMGPPEQGGMSVPDKPRGLVSSGNIDIHNRPVVKNSDGTISTVRSISVNFDGKEVLIPTVSDDGKILSNDEAVDLYKKTGKNLGIFDTPENATAYAESLHNEQAQEYGSTLLTPSSPPSAGAAIMKPAQEQGVAVQPGATPRQALNNFDQAYSYALLRANQIPNVSERESTIKALNSQRSIYVQASSAYTSQILTKAQQLANDPKFTDVNQIPPEMSVAILQDSPQTWQYLQGRAEYNAKRGSGQISEDMKKYGTGYYKAFRAIVNHEITSPEQLYKLLPDDQGQGGDITYAGYDELLKRFSKDPMSQAQEEMRKNMYDSVKKKISNKDENFGIPDPPGEKNWSSAMPILDDAIQQGLKDGHTWGELTDEHSKLWVGNAVKQFFKAPTQTAIDGLNPVPEQGNISKFFFGDQKKHEENDLLIGLTSETDPVKRREIVGKLKKMGSLAADLYVPKVNVPTADQ